MTRRHINVLECHLLVYHLKVPADWFHVFLLILAAQCCAPLRLKLFKMPLLFGAVWGNVHCAILPDVCVCAVLKNSLDPLLCVDVAALCNNC